MKITDCSNCKNERVSCVCPEGFQLKLRPLKLDEKKFDQVLKAIRPGSPEKLEDRACDY